MSRLPPGFVLDRPAPAQASPAALPDGFVLDAPIASAPSAPSALPPGFVLDTPAALPAPTPFQSSIIDLPEGMTVGEAMDQQAGPAPYRPQPMMQDLPPVVDEAYNLARGSVNYLAGMVPSMGSIGPRLMSSYFQAAGDINDLTGGMLADPEQVERDNAYWREVNRLSAESAQSAQNLLPPTRSAMENPLGTAAIANTVGQAAGQLVTAMAPGGRAIVAADSFGRHGNETYTEMVQRLSAMRDANGGRLYSDAEVERMALKASHGVGLVNAALDAVDPITGAGRRIVGQQASRQIVKSLLQGAGQEAVLEGTQSLVSATPKYVYGTEELTGANVVRDLQQAGIESIHGAIGGGFAGTIEGFAGQYIPPPPPGFVVDDQPAVSPPPLPPGFVLDESVADQPPGPPPQQEQPVAEAQQEPENQPAEEVVDEVGVSPGHPVDSTLPEGFVLDDMEQFAREQLGQAQEPSPQYVQPATPLPRERVEPQYDAGELAGAMRGVQDRQQVRQGAQFLEGRERTVPAQYDPQTLRGALPKPYTPPVEQPQGAGRTTPPQQTPQRPAAKQKPTDRDPATLTPDEFYNAGYYIHSDLRGGGREGILRDGFRRAMNANAVPVTRPGDTNIIARKYAPKPGADIYLIPPEGIEDGPNGPRVKEGYKPRPEHIVTLREGETLHEAIVRQSRQPFNQPAPTTPVEESQPELQAEDYGTLDAPNRPIIGRHFSRRFASGASYPTINDARREAGQLLKGEVGPGTQAAKHVDEAVEIGVTIAARDIVRAASDPQDAFDKLLDLYQRQPNLSVRTSTSMEQQAYSTPAPLAFAASHLAGITPTSTIYEPTAGNGMLTIGTDPTRTLANELNPDRAAALEAQGIRTTREDATAYLPQQKVDAVIMNPPFGHVRGEGAWKTWTIDSLTTNEVDHAIVLNSLKAMKEDGGAVMIIGAKGGTETGIEKRKAYLGRNNQAFFKKLYSDYNVLSHFTVNGDLYSRQGAAFPVDVIVIRGRGGQSRPLPWKADGVVPVYNTWQEIANVLNSPLAVPRKPAGVDAAPADAGSAVDPAPAEGSGTDAGPVPRPTGGPGAVDGGRGGGRRAGVSSPVAEGGGESRPARTEPSPVTGESNRPGVGGPVAPAPTAQPDPIPDQSETDNDVRSSDRGDRSGDVARPAPADRALTDDADAAPASIEKPNDTRPKQQDAATEFQVEYKPASKVESVGTLIPRNMQTATREALADIEAQRGGVETFVAEQLGFPADKLGNYFSAEQVDALAMAIHNHKQGSGFILGDQTGVGKGRVVAGMIRYAQRQGLLPVFLTQQPALFGDMVRDLTDVGLSTKGKPFEPLPTNNLTGENKIPLPDGRILSTRTKGHEGMVQAAVRSFLDGGKLEAGGKTYGALFTTYSQLQTVKGNEVWRHSLMRGLADRAFIILDESHEAGGGAKQERKAKNAPPSRSEFIRSLVQKAAGVLYSSATYAKRPDVMDLYSRTDMVKAVGGVVEKLPDAIKQGGVPLQQAVAANLAQVGQYARRERTFAGVDFVPAVVNVDLALADQLSASFRAVQAFDKAKEGAVAKVESDVVAEAKRLGVDSSTGGAGVTSTNFSSILWNIVDQMLLSLKAQQTADAAIAAVKAGERPVIVVDNTMEAVLDRFIQMDGIRSGEPMEATFRDIVRRYLERSRELIVQDGETSYRHYLTDQELGDKGLAAYNEAAKVIDAMMVDGLPVSPLDFILHRLRQAGYNFAEVTGRGTVLEYQENGPPLVRERKKEEIGVKGKVSSVKAYNDGSIDGILLNRSASTGLSLHSSPKFKDTRRRHMIIAQAAKNIDTFMQMLGRVHRTGQLNPPKYTLLMSDAPAENRPAAVLVKKLASLNASVTASSKGSVSFDVPDLINEVGDQVVAEYLQDNPDMADLLDVQPAFDDSGETSSEDIASKATGRASLLPVADQQRFWTELMERFEDRIKELDAINDNPLVAHTLDLDARVLEESVIFAGEEGSENPFAGPAQVQRVDVKRQGKPFTSEQVRQKVAEFYGGKGRQTWQNETDEELEREFQKYVVKFIDTMTSEQSAQKRHAEATKQLYRVKSAIEQYPVGTSVAVTLPKDGGTFDAIVIGFERKGKPRNPAATGAWVLRLAVTDAMRQVSIPLSRIGDSGYTIVRNYFDMEEFDDAQSASREERHIATGNLLAAFGQLEDGRVINYTDANGDIRQGVLLPKNFDMQKHVEKDPIRFEKPAEAMRFLRADREHSLRSADDQQLRVSIVRDELVLEAPKSKSKGAKYTLNKAILKAAAGAEFVSSGSKMRLFAPSERAEKVLRAVMEQYPLAAYENKEAAREAAGMPSVQQQQERMRRAPSQSTSPGDFPARGGTFERIEQWAKDKLDGMGGMGLRSGIDPLADTKRFALLTIIGAAKIGKGSQRFATWSRNMLSEFKDLTGKQLVKLWGSARKFYKLSEAERAEWVNREMGESAPETIKQTVARNMGRIDAKRLVGEMALLRIKFASAQKASREGFQAASRELTAIKQQIVRVAQSLPDSSLRARFLSLVARAKTIGQIGHAYRLAEDLLADFDVRQSLKSVQALTGTLKLDVYDVPGPPVQGPKNRKDAKPVGAVKLREDGTPDVPMRRIDLNTLPLASADGSRQYRQEAMALIERARNVKAALENAKTTGQKYVAVAEFEQINRDLREIAANAQAEREIFVVGKKMEREAVVNEALDAIGRPGESPSLSSNQPDDAPLIKRIFGRGSLAMQTIADHLFAGRKSAHDVLIGNIRAGQHAYHEGIRQFTEAMGRSFETAGIAPGSQKLSEWINDRRSIDLPDGGKLELTRSEMVDLVAGSEDPQTAALVARGVKWVPDASKVASTPMALTAEDIAAVADQLTPGERGIIEAFKAFNKDNLTPLSISAKLRLSGSAPTPHDGYYPRSRYLQGTAPEPQGWKGYVGRAMENISSMEQREQGTGTPLVIKSFLDRVFDYAHETNKLIHLAEPVRTAAAIFEDPRVDRAMARRFGPSMNKRFDTFLEDSMAVSLRGRDTFAGKVSRVLTRNLSRAWLQLNPSPVLKNVMGGTVNLLPEFDLRDWSAGVRKMFDPGTYQRMLEGSPVAWDRYHGGLYGQYSPMTGRHIDPISEMKWGEAMRASLSAAAKGNVKIAGEDFGKAVDALKFMEWGDSVPLRAAWAASEAFVERTMAGATAEAKAAAVAEKFHEALYRTQNGTSSTEISGMSSDSRRNPMLQPFFMFTSDSNKRYNQLARLGDADKARRVKTVAAAGLNTVINSAVGVLVKGGPVLVGAALAGRWLDDDEEERITGNAGWDALRAVLSTGYGGDTILDMVRRQISGYSHGAIFSHPALQIMEDVTLGMLQFGNAVQNYIDDEPRTDAEQQRAWDRLTRAAGKELEAVRVALGDPTVPLWRMAGKVVDAGTDEQANEDPRLTAERDRMKQRQGRSKELRSSVKGLDALLAEYAELDRLGGRGDRNLSRAERVRKARIRPIEQQYRKLLEDDAAGRAGHVRQRQRLLEKLVERTNAIGAGSGG